MSMEPLELGDFDDYFRAVHGAPPFRWQRRLLEQVVADDWPPLLDLPTGVGKTAALDIALFHLALDAGRPAADRRACRRILLVVDRRVVVDQAHERARRIAHRLAQVDGAPVLRRVADHLRKLGGSERPLEAVLLRGGTYRDASWARTPDQPLLGASTVDQVGSRLLFRGYGVSESARPIHAGLLANDTLLLLDEVHLSSPFLETIRAIERYRTWAEQPLPGRFRAVPMSATAPETKKTSFRLLPEDREDHLVERRLSARKVARLEEIKVKGEEDERRQAFATRLAELARGHASSGARTIAVVVNRVDTARRVHAELAHTADAVILTGRMRPVDRDEVYSRIQSRVEAGRTRSTDDRLLYVVATQCVEAGADFDFDALVTECASVDALRQRFGRLDRLGDLGKSNAHVAVRKDLLNPDDAVYGTALSKTWEWLTRSGDAVDFGIDHFVVPESGLAELVRRPESAPVLLPAHLDTWVQTCPAPAVEPEPALWLHGKRAEPADVQIVWRADIEQDLFESSASLEDRTRIARERLAACPPVSAEALAVPFHAARRWLKEGDGADLADVEGVAEAGTGEVGSGGRLCIRWAGDRSEPAAASNIRPGDTIVVPASYGGIKDHVWDPKSTQAVLDRAEVAQLTQRGRVLLRLHPAVLEGWGLGQPPQIDPDADADEEAEALTTWLETVSPVDGADSPVRRVLRVVVETLRNAASKPSAQWQCLEPLPSTPHPYWFVQLRRRFSPNVLSTLLSSSDGPPGDDASTDPETSPFTAVEVELDAHSTHVQDRAGQMARNCGFPDHVAELISRAGAMHDLGKADPRFQAMLRGGSSVPTAVGAPLLAKSAIPHRNWRARRQAARASGYPSGQRHEMLSVALAESGGTAEGGDEDLVLHLIASHHGHARPLAPVVDDPSPVAVTLPWRGQVLTARSDHSLARFDSPIAERFWRLVRRHGWYGLAWTEAILRLADHRCSEEESAEGDR